MRQRIYLGLGDGKSQIEVLVNLPIEENNREDVYEVLRDSVDLIYDGEYDERGEND
jgi:hypothetical protein